MHEHAYTYMYTHRQVYTHTCKHRHIYTHAHACTHTRVHTHVRMHTQTQTCTQTRVHTHMYTHMYTHTHRHVYTHVHTHSSTHQICWAQKFNNHIKLTLQGCFLGQYEQSSYLLSFWISFRYLSFFSTFLHSFLRDASSLAAPHDHHPVRGLFRVRVGESWEELLRSDLPALVRGVRGALFSL